LIVIWRNNINFWNGHVLLTRLQKFVRILPASNEVLQPLENFLLIERVVDI